MNVKLIPGSPVPTSFCHYEEHSDVELIPRFTRARFILSLRGA